jgi:predicted peptidase
MTGLSLLLPVAAVALVGAAGIVGARQEAEVPLLPPGLHTRVLAQADGPPVAYAIQVPEGYAPDARVPLVLALHYGGEPSTGAGRGVVSILVGPALAELGAVIVAPDALLSGWDAPENEQAVLALLDAVAVRYKTDPARVVVTGFSMGGIGTWHYAAKFSSRFSAALPVAGRPAEEGQEWAVPVFAVGSRRDTVVPMAATSQRIELLRQRGVNVRMVVLETPTHFQTAAHADGLRRAVPWLRNLWGE